MLVLAGCGGAERSAAPGEGFPSQSFDEVIVTTAQLAPGDTASLLEMMRQTMTEIDAVLDQMERHDTTFVGATRDASRHLTLWSQQGRPRKLLVASLPVGEMVGEEAAYWFVDDELRAALLPDEGFFLEADRMFLWTDAGLDPIRDVDPEIRMERETALLAEVSGWLAVMGIPLP